MSSRGEIYKDALRIFFDNPVLGVGWGEYQQHSESIYYRHAHNVVLELLSEMGMVGLIAFIFMVAPVARIVTNTTLVSSMGPLATTCAALILAQITMMQFSGDLGTNRLFFFFCMLLFVIIRVEVKESETFSEDQRTVV